MKHPEETGNPKRELVKRLLPNVSKSTLEANGLLEAPVNAPGSPVQSFKPKRGTREPNKTEADFARFMKMTGRGELDFEPVKLRIGANCYYTPDWGDFGAIRPTLYEVKGGHIWDDSLVKFKAAKERHKWCDMELWQKKKGGNWTRLL
jgi:hypothetical protein